MPYPSGWRFNWFDIRCCTAVQSLYDGNQKDPYDEFHGGFVIVYSEQNRRSAKVRVIDGDLYYIIYLHITRLNFIFRNIFKRYYANTSTRYADVTTLYENATASYADMTAGYGDKGICYESCLFHIADRDVGVAGRGIIIADNLALIAMIK